MSAEPATGGSAVRWKVLLVDDEPAVHEVSRLILAGTTFEGREVELIDAGSAGEARALLEQHADVALALVDVVMETDDAGIALVQYIREHRRDHDMQIVLRTGQPGMAPERDVVQRYEINGYFLKTDITAQRLHSIVISALRSYRHARSLRGAAVPAAAAADAAARPPDALREALAAELSAAADGTRVLLQVQPEVVLATNVVSGVELVPQWRTSLGLLPAGRLSETLPHGAVRQRIVRWLVEQACLWARSWRSDDGVALGVSIPFAGDSLCERATVATIVDAASAAGASRGALDLLVGEATLLGAHPEVRASVAALRAAGVTLTLADFGARTISLQRLNQLVPDRLKIHRLFVRGVAQDPERMAVARSLIALAQTLNIVAIADGISSDADAQFFKWEGCDLGQGDALARACAPADVAELLQHGKRASQ